MRHPSRVLLLTLACSAALAAQAAPASGPINVPAGDLAVALNTLARQSDTQLVYRADELKGRRTAGVQGADSADQALQQLLHGSGFGASRDQATGAVLVARVDTPKRAPAPQQAAPQDAAGGSPAQAQEEEVTEIEAVQVTGSRIPRTQIEGPSPISVITAEQIRANGFTTMPEVMRSMTQNNGSTQSPQSLSNSDFTPGAQQVDLRGLGPNHTLVLVNGRRLADFPLPMDGGISATDISSIPLGMVERIEVLTGSASAIYGSDAVSGVVNIILKKQADGLTMNFRYGDTQAGGGESYNLTLAGGFVRGGFNAVMGVELNEQKPLWGYQRERQDSSSDIVDFDNYYRPLDYFARSDWYDSWLDPGEAACNDPGNRDSYHITDNRYGESYCGSDTAAALQTIIHERRGITAYGSFSYDFGGGTEWFADVQLGYQKMKQMGRLPTWETAQTDAITDYFFNQSTGELEWWRRRFTPEELGGVSNSFTETTNKTLGLSTGLRGTFAQDWDYEAAFSYSQYKARVSWPRIISDVANDYFMGPQLGTDDDGYPIYDGDLTRFYTPLTKAQLDSMLGRIVYNPESHNQTLSFTVTNANLFDLPGGAAGIAATAELGNQGYDLNTDPRATGDSFYYWGWKDQDGSGSRNRWALASELRMPVLESLNLSVAGRYDQYRYSGRSQSKFTYSTGLEWRPIDTLLVRGSYGTAFRAPELHHLYAGVGYVDSGGIDYYRCATEQPDVPASDCDFADEGFQLDRRGDLTLSAETSTSWTAGVVWSPVPELDFAVDWYDIDMRNQTQSLSVNQILQNEADCRLGIGQDPNSQFCADTIARVVRSGPDNRIASVHGGYVNIGMERTSGLDASANYRLETDIGLFRFGANYTWVNSHERKDAPDAALVDMLAINSGYDIPRDKFNASIGWERNGWDATLYASRLGKIPTDENFWYQDWDESYLPDVEAYLPATWRYNASVGYRVNDRARVSLAVNNLTNAMPPRDFSNIDYPFYNFNWYDTIGRAYYLNFTWKFGGEKL
ncbi:TonB-dependent receptor [Pseudoxanthomonas koreensis]|uniref:TonB-dependent receptor n=1 Tax=Pseudoxanthomonas koreensis TaxID=266061 RepID=UPI001390D3BF|nr:TonB-dependent receptor [Pseudoxanthomonas koreensis]KAF1697113.1 TonB-dependent receptor [Pseudoxanthomonas koreensis]